MTAHEHHAWTSEPTPKPREPMPIHMWMIGVMVLSIAADVCQLVTSGLFS